MAATLAHTVTSSTASLFGGWLRMCTDRLQARWSTLRTVVAARPLTALEQADRVRAKADKQLASDPVFAQELYAAADRHERAARA